MPIQENDAPPPVALRGTQNAGVRDAIAVACFFLSGFAGLVYEVCWIRMASLAFGSTTLAVSTVLAVFFLGLAVGSYAFGRISRRTLRPLRLFAALELGVAALALASPAAFDHADALYGAVYRAAGEQAALLGLARFSLICLVLLPPTILMGGTLPLFCRQFVLRPSRIARSVGLLYGINTLGAALGCAVAGLVLIPRIGTQYSIALGASLSAIAALGTGFLRLRVRESVRVPHTGALPSSSRDATAVGVLIALAGFVALGSEVLWTRHLALLVHASVYTYTLTLCAVLVGIVLGSGVGAFLFDRKGRRAFAFGALQVGNGLLVLALMLLPADLWQRLQPLPLSTYFFLLLPPAILSGSSFPLAVRMVVAEPELAGAGVGRLSALNTLGGIAGSLGVGFLVLPHFGHQTALLFTTAISVAAGIATWWLLDRVSSRPMRAISISASLLVWAAIPIAAGTNLPADFLLAAGSADILIDYREGRSSNLAVLERPAGFRVLEIDRLWQGSNRKSQQIVAAHVPMLLHPQPRRVLVVGAGTGQTASRFLMYGVERLDCVDIEPAVFDVIREHFDSKWMEDPRVSLLAEDGRSFLAHTRRRYDVISIEVGQILRPGVPLFYTSDFYHRARRRLNPGGFLSQFVPIAFFEPEQFRSVIASFLDVFPQSFLWYNSSELLLVGVNAPRLRLRAERLELLSREGAVRSDLSFPLWGGPRHSLHHRTVFLGSFLAGPEGLAEISHGVPLYRDDRPVLDHATRAARPEDMNEIPIVALLREHLDPVADVVLAELSEGDRAAIEEVRRSNLGDLERRALHRRLNTLGAELPAGEALALLEQAVERNGESFAANLRLAEALAGRAQLAAARRYYAKALDIRPDDPRAMMALERIRRRIGDAE